jgi:hypothetical protein
VFEYAENYFSPKEKRSPKPPAAAKAKTKSKSPEKKPALNALIIHKEGSCDVGTFIKSTDKDNIYEVEFGELNTKDEFFYLQNYAGYTGKKLYELFQTPNLPSTFVVVNDQKGQALCSEYINYFNSQKKTKPSSKPRTPPSSPPKEVMLLFSNGDNFYGHILPSPPSKLAALGNKRKIEFTNNNNEVTTTEAFYVDITKKGVDSLENIFKDNGVNVIYTDKKAQNRDSALDFQMYKQGLLTTPPKSKSALPKTTTTTPKLKSIVPPLQYNIFSAAPRSVKPRTFFTRSPPRSAFIQSPKKSAFTPRSSIKFTQQPTAFKPHTMATSKPLTVAASKPPQTVAAYKKPKFYSIGTIKIGKPTKPKLKTIRRTNRFNNRYRNSYRNRTFNNRYGNRTFSNRYSNRYRYKTIGKNRARRYLSFSRSSRRPTTNYNEDDFF